MMETPAGLRASLAVAGFLVVAANGVAVAGQEAAARNRLIEAAFQQALQTGTAQAGAAGEQPPLTLAAALAQARINSQQLRSAVAAAQLATEDRVQAHAAL